MMVRDVLKERLSTAVKTNTLSRIPAIKLIYLTTAVMMCNHPGNDGINVRVLKSLMRR